MGSSLLGHRYRVDSRLSLGLALNALLQLPPLHRLEAEDLRLLLEAVEVQAELLQRALLADELRLEVRVR